MYERAAEDEATNNSSIPIGETKDERVSLVPMGRSTEWLYFQILISAAIQRRAQECSKPETRRCSTRTGDGGNQEGQTFGRGQGYRGGKRRCQRAKAEAEIGRHDKIHYDQTDMVTQQPVTVFSVVLGSISASREPYYYCIYFTVGKYR
jgi:hypothetical protein